MTKTEQPMLIGKHYNISFKETIEITYYSGTGVDTEVSLANTSKTAMFLGMNSNNFADLKIGMKICSIPRIAFKATLL